MSTNEQRIREFAYQIWESEGKPHGQTERHWNMACKLAHTHAESDIQAANDGSQTGSTEPIEPISPTQPAQPVPPSDPIQPTDPVTPSQPVQPGSPTAELEVSAASALKKPRAKAATTDTNIGEIIIRVAANEKAAAKKKSAGKGELNTDVKIKTDLRKKAEPKIKAEAKETDINTATKPKKTKTEEKALS